MTTRKRRLLGIGAMAIATAAMPGLAPAAGSDPLFINLTSDDPHRVSMALSFGENQLKRGHPLAVFFNDRAVLVAAKAAAARFGAQQEHITLLLAAGATLLVCPMCMKHYGVTEADLLPGLVLGSPERTGAALFRANSRTLTW